LHVDKTLGADITVSYQKILHFQENGENVYVNFGVHGPLNVYWALKNICAFFICFQSYTRTGQFSSRLICCSIFILVLMSTNKCVALFLRVGL